jgi:hypothetical protein
VREFSAQLPHGGLVMRHEQELVAGVELHNPGARQSLALEIDPALATEMVKNSSYL